MKCVRLPTYTTSAATLTEIIASEWSCPQTPLSERCIFKKRICRALLNCLLCEWLCNVNVSITLHFVQQEVLQQENYWRRGEQHMKPLDFSLAHTFLSHFSLSLTLFLSHFSLPSLFFSLIPSPIHMSLLSISFLNKW